MLTLLSFFVTSTYYRYGADSTRGSCIFKFITPAWSNNNLRNLGDHIYSNLIMAHVRAASSGHDPLAKMIVSNENCHPFKYGRWTFMHNGGTYVSGSAI